MKYYLIVTMVPWHPKDVSTRVYPSLYSRTFYDSLEEVITGLPKEPPKEKIKIIEVDTDNLISLP